MTIPRRSPSGPRRYVSQAVSYVGDGAATRRLVFPEFEGERPQGMVVFFTDFAGIKFASMPGALAIVTGGSGMTFEEDGAVLLEPPGSAGLNVLGTTYYAIAWF